MPSTSGMPQGLKPMFLLRIHLTTEVTEILRQRLKTKQDLLVSRQIPFALCSYNLSVFLPPEALPILLSQISADVTDRAVHIDAEPMIRLAQSGHYITLIENADNIRLA